MPIIKINCREPNLDKGNHECPCECERYWVIKEHVSSSAIRPWLSESLFNASKKLINGADLVKLIETYEPSIRGRNEAYDSITRYGETRLSSNPWTVVISNCLKDLLTLHQANPSDDIGALGKYKFWKTRISDDKAAADNWDAVKNRLRLG